ncbi:helix-turn-helix transcriptional regulator [Puniceibacterium sediminis]|uniref:HTH luxR-type domain-containing protein n=1 Tax=Puniceibacterium sediminis TaxID=1608407 RepID=A0A238YLI9_9RHOB|nr:hypothetical protein [Puniceibacterium sediminis]SNR71910.1 hypothetical protein SAMN06265370_11817 [Puniceibacterium sediminis]
MVKTLFAAASGYTDADSAGANHPVDLWPAFLKQLGAALGAQSVSLQVVSQGRLVQVWQIGATQTEPAIANLEKMRTGRVYSQLDLPGAEDTEQPLRALRWAVGANGFAALVLRRRTRDFRAADAAQLSRLAPYLGPALSGWRALGRERSRAALDRRLGQDLGAFWLRLTPSGRVIDMAPEMRARLASLSGLRLQPNGWLEFSDPAAALAFRQALATAQVGPAASGMVELSRNPPLQLVICEDTLADERTLVAILRQGLLARSLPVEHVAEYFGLSRSEARLTMLLCDGFSLQDAAVELGWTIETARSCSKQIFARMGVSGQPGVVRKVLGSAVWLS